VTVPVSGVKLPAGFCNVAGAAAGLAEGRAVTATGALLAAAADVRLGVGARWPA